MKRTPILILLLLLPLLAIANMFPGPHPEQPPFALNIVKLQINQRLLEQISLPEDLTVGLNEFGVDELDELIKSFGSAKIYRAHIRLKDRAFEIEHGVDRWVLVKYDNNLSDLQATLRAFKELDQYIDDVCPETLHYLQYTPNDTYYANNWGHNNTAQLPAYQSGSHSGPGVGTIGFDTDVNLAWDLSQGFGNSSIIIAVIDTGVDLNHPDLRLVTGYDYGDNDSNPMDDSGQQGHGTACSGVAAGIANNNLGVTGVAGGCSVMPLKIATTAGDLTGTAIENALYHCGNAGVDVASMSYGGSYQYGTYPSTDAAYNFAYNNGVVLLAATANGNTSSIAYPANHPYVISVGAASPTGQRKSTSSSDGETWWGSNYGSTTQDARDAVDIMAPTILPATDITGAGNGYNTSSDYYLWFNGTSCATPYAAGVAALLLSANPNLSPTEIRTALTSTATDMTYDGGAGWDRYTGYGLVNARNALLTLTPGMPFCQITSPANMSTHNLGSSISVNVNASDSDGSISNVKFYVDDVLQYTDYSSPYSWAWNTSSFSAGNRVLKATATDNLNNQSNASVTVTLLSPASEGFESGNFSAYPWVQGGNAPWTVQSTDVYSGSYAAKSGVITHNNSSTMDLTLNLSASGTVSFYYKVSSESSYDFLKFYIDGIQQEQWSGTVGWTQASYAVSSGEHTFSWVYYKDGSVDSGSDCAWVDHIVFPPHAQALPPTITWNQNSFSQELAPGGSGSQTLILGNTGTQNLSYLAALPSGNTTVLDESFEAASLPTGWSQEYTSGNIDWIFAAGGYGGHPANAYDGSYNARFYYGSNTTAYLTKLVSPALNLAAASSASLSFWHTQEQWAGDQDELRVYYKTSAGGSWNLLAEYTQSISSWTQRTLNLPSLSSAYYLAFEGKSDYGYGVCLDKIVVTAQQASQVTWVTLNGGSSVNGTISGPDGTHQIPLQFNTVGLSTGTYNTTITITSNSSTNSTLSIPVSLVVASSPGISISTNSLSYGLVRIGQSSTQSFQISNPGTAVLSGTIQTPAAFNVSFLREQESPEKDSGLLLLNNEQERNSLAFSVNPGASKTYQLVFTPTQVASYNSVLNIQHNATGSPSQISLVASGGKSTLGLSDESIQIELGFAEADNYPIEIYNDGNMSLQYSLELAGNPAWLRLNGGTSASGTIAAGGAAVQVNVGFNSNNLAPGTYSGLINLTCNDTDIPSLQIPVELEVINTIPSLQLPDSFGYEMGQNLVVDFSPYIDDQDNQQLSLTCDHTGNINVEISGFTVTFSSLPAWYGEELISFQLSDGIAEVSDDITISVERVVTELAAPVVTVTQYAGLVLLEWTAVDDANLYRVYRSNNPVDGFVLLGSTSDLFWEDMSLLDRAFYRVYAVYQAPAINIQP